MGGLGVRQDVADVTGVGALAAHAALHRVGFDQAWAEAVARRTGRGTYSYLHIAERDHLRLTAGRQVRGERRLVFEHRLPIANVVPVERALPRRFALDADPAAEQHQAQFFITRRDRQCFAQAQAVGGEADVFQLAVAQLDHGAAAGVAFDQQAHDATLSSSNARKVS
ncbi:hypothetical protein D3C75_805030 [compost metagenome]